MSLLSLRLQKKKIIGVDVVLRVRCYTEAVKKLSLPDLPHRAGNEKFCCRVENPSGKNFGQGNWGKLSLLSKCNLAALCIVALKQLKLQWPDFPHRVGKWEILLQGNGKSLGGNFDAEIFYSNCTYSFLDFKKHFSASLSISHVL